MTYKILFAIPQQARFLSPISRALDELNYHVVHFDYLKPDFISSGLGMSKNILSSIRQMSNLYINWINDQLLLKIKQTHPHYFLTIKGETILPSTIKAINSLGIPTINWFPDNIGLWNFLITTAPYYQYYFSVCKHLTQVLNKIGRKTIYLPVAGEADTNFKVNYKNFDVVFVGHKTQRRIKYFSALKDYNFSLWGYSNWKNSPLMHFYNGELDQQQMKQVFRKSKIVINVSTGEEGIPVVIANLRNFESTGVGAFVLSEYNVALSQLFTENIEMVYFKSIVEMISKVDYFLKHEDLRNRIAYSGWLKTKNHHTYHDRIKKMFHYIG